MSRMGSLLSRKSAGGRGGQKHVSQHFYFLVKVAAMES